MGRFLVRRLLPATIVLPILLGLLRLQGEQAGLYGTTVGTMLFVSITVLAFSILIFWTARLFDRLEDERDRMVESLRKAEQKYRSIFDNSPEGIYQTTLDGRLRTINPAMARIFGYDSPEEMVSSVSDASRLLYVYPDQREEFARRVREEGSVSGFEVLGRRKDGTEVWLSVSGHLQRDAVGAVVGIEGMVADIAERKRAEEALRRSEERLRLVVEGVKDYAIFMLDPKGMIVSWNEGAHRIKGYDEQEILGQHFSIFYPEEDRKRGKPEHCLEMAQEEGTYEEEGWRVHKDGSRFWASVLITALRDEAGLLHGFSKITRDVTERKRAEEEMRKVKEAAEEASLAKSEFLANMSHEIRTPMNAVIGMTGLLLGTDLDPEQREYAETVRSSGEDLLTIINDILDFSKIEAGKVHIEYIAFDLRSAVEETVGLLAERAYGRGLELASLVEADVPGALEGDPGRIRQVLMNLLGNAIKFTEEGEVVLRVGLVEESDDVAVVRFEVKDTGIGMAEVQRSRLFESFSQADTSTTRKYGGTGLGLAISKQLVELMGGEIGVESEPGVGSTFFFTLPLKKQPEAAQRRDFTPRTDLSDLRVLFVDDNETNRKIFHEQLTSWGMKKGGAEHGQKALEMLREAAQRDESYDLAILDMQMPQMDGIELARRIKEDPLISSTRLVMLSSPGQASGSEETGQVGIEAHLTKPVRPARLFDTISMVMETPFKESPAPSTAEVSGSSADVPLIATPTLRQSKERSSHARVLVVEDNRVNQKVALRILEWLGYRAEVAATGVEAVESVSRMPYAAVLMDVQMPEMDGYEATKEIRKREGPQNRHTPIIAMTADAMQGDREESLEAGMDDYVSKPVKPKELGAVLQQWISQPDEKASPPEEQNPDGGASESTTGPLDQDVLARLREFGDEEFLDKLAGLFLEDTISLLEALRKAIGVGDAPSVKRVAHALKGSSENMGALKMSTICAELQDVGDSGELERAPVLVERLEAEFGRVRTALEAEMEGRRG